MFIRKVAIAAAASAVGLAGIAATAYADQPIPSLVYRTGAYAPSGIPLANGYADYFAMINHRDGGVNGVKLAMEECDTGYATDRGVECYDRTKSSGGGATVYSPWSTGITYALIEKATADKIPILSMGYGRTSAANGYGRFRILPCRAESVCCNPRSPVPHTLSRSSPPYRERQCYMPASRQSNPSQLGIVCNNRDSSPSCHDMDQNTEDKRVLHSKSAKPAL